MKKILVLAVAMVFAVAACGNSADTEAEATQEPVGQADDEEQQSDANSKERDPDGDEYAVYENGEIIVEAHEIVNPLVFDSYIVYDKDYNILYDLSDQSITTKRDIGLGSSEDELIEAYGEENFYFGDFEVDMTLNEFIANKEKYGNPTSYSLIMESAYLKDGNILNYAEEKDFMEQHNVNAENVRELREEYFDKIYNLTMVVEEGKVKIIIISNFVSQK